MDDSLERLTHSSKGITLHNHYVLRLLGTNKPEYSIADSKYHHINNPQIPIIEIKDSDSFDRFKDINPVAKTIGLMVGCEKLPDTAYEKINFQDRLQLKKTKVGRDKIIGNIRRSMHKRMFHSILIGEDGILMQKLRREHGLIYGISAYSAQPLLSCQIGDKSDGFFAFTNVTTMDGKNKIIEILNDVFSDIETHIIEYISNKEIFTEETFMTNTWVYLHCDILRGTPYFIDYGLDIEFILKSLTGKNLISIDTMMNEYIRKEDFSFKILTFSDGTDLQFAENGE